MAYIKEIINKNGISYQVNIRVNGYKPVYKTFKGDKAKTRTKKWASIIEGQMNDGTYKEEAVFEKDSPQALIKTLHDLIEYFKNNVAPKRYIHAENYNCMFDWWDQNLGFLKLDDITTSIITQKKEYLEKERIYKWKDKNKSTTRSANTINKYLMCLSAILTYATKELELLAINPCSNVKLMPKSKGRTRFLSLAEIKLFLNACKNHSPMIYLFAMISLSTGARYSEVLHLKVENIDFDNHQIFYLNTKNKEHRGVPINEELSELISDYLKENNITNGNVFRAKRSDGSYPCIKQYLEKIIKNIGLEDFHIHDIRHTTASYIAMNGGSLLDIAEILGHKSLVMARRYSHLTQKHTATVLNKMTNKIIPDD